MNTDPHVYLVSYDIADAKRLRRVFKTMRGFGDHLQYSVFLCVLSPLQRERMVGRLEELIHHGEDQVLIVPLGAAGAQRSWRMSTLGLPYVHPERCVRVF